ncbi:MAG: hypothetical protein ACJ72U_15065 [Nitrososphaeraceae archaeon]
MVLVGKQEPQSFTTDITDKEDLEQIREISNMLNPKVKDDLS